MAVGASGGLGLLDLRDLLEALPGDLPAIVLAVLHRPSGQFSHLKEVLSRRSALPVLIPQEDDEFHAGVCYIGEPAAHLELAARSRVHLVAGNNDKYRNRTVDLLFASVAEHARDRAIGVVLRGELADGTRGLAAIHFAGGATMVLGAGGSASEGMPQNATNYGGPIDFTGAVDEIAREIARRVSLSNSERAPPPPG
ncbi:MAG: chemotaxis protein CheB [Phenylobacterium sp.]